MCYLGFRLRGKLNTIVRDYVLPDYANIRKGYAKSQEDSTGRPAGSEQVNAKRNLRWVIIFELLNSSISLLFFTTKIHYY